MTSRRTLSLIAVAVALSACGAEGGSSDRVGSVASLQGDTTSGSALYGAQCASCHGASGGGGVGPSLVGMDETAVVEAMLSGPSQMPAFDTLTDQQLADLTQFVIEME